jgi:shikimate kinase
MAREEESILPCSHLVTLSPCHRVIFLVGYRGTGKSTIARLLGNRLGWEWTDADTALEHRFGRTIPAIFAQDGEVGFRSMESAVLEDLCRLRNHVIATGGGVVLSADNRERMRQAGQVIWLMADADTIWQRLQADAAIGRERPMLTIGGRAEVEELLQIRQPHYRACANLMVETGGRTPEEVAEAILAWLKDQ